MTFTIPEFWCGVLATIGAELLALICATIYRNRKSKYTVKK